jgi:hypothetical protein
MNRSLCTRLALLEAAEPARAWETTVGLSSLLAYAKTLPLRDDPMELDEISDSGMGRLLREARQWREERP